MLEYAPSIVVLAAIAAFLVGLSKGGLPSVGVLAVPLMAFVMSPVAAAALLLPIYVASDMVGLVLYRRQFSARNLAILVPASIIGVLIGWIFSSQLSPGFIGMLVGLVGLFYCFNAWIASRLKREAKSANVAPGVFWGVLTGLTSFVSHAGAPTFQMYVLPQKLEKLTYAGTATILFAIVNAVKIVPYWELQQFSGFDPVLMSVLAVTAIAGTFIGKKLTEVIPTGLFFRFVEVTLFLLSLKLIADYLLAL